LSTRKSPLASAVKPRSAASSPAERAKQTLAALHWDYADAGCALTHETPFQLIAATILSAQCTDVMVNKVTPSLFAEFPTPATLAAADPARLEKLIHSTGFYRNKAKNLIGMAKGLVERFGGEVPRTMAELLTLPGVARKTANVVLGTAFAIADGVVVDTHVIRLSQRLGLTRQKTPEKIEAALQKIVPRSEWIFFSHALIWHGRRVCAARSPKCGECSMKSFCPSGETQSTTKAQRHKGRGQK
jgi:endonuclease-3